jgi:hypothetical protein
VEFNLNGLPDNVVHISGFRGEDGSIMELNTMSLVDTVCMLLYHQNTGQNHGAKQQSVV